MNKSVKNAREDLMKIVTQSVLFKKHCHNNTVFFKTFCFVYMFIAKPFEKSIEKSNEVK